MNQEPTQRQRKVNEELRRILATVINEGVLHNIPTDITVTEVRTSDDLRQATVFVSSLTGENIDDIITALQNNKGRLRKELALRLNLKFTPDLSFKPDKTLDYAKKIEGLLNNPEVKKDLE